MPSPMAQLPHSKSVGLRILVYFCRFCLRAVRTQFFFLYLCSLVLLLLIFIQLNVQRKGYGMTMTDKYRVKNNDRYLSMPDFAKRTNRDSGLSRILFRGNNTNQTIPEFPDLGPKTPVDRSQDWSKNSQGHYITLVNALDNEYAYVEKVNHAMQKLYQDYPHLKNARANACIFILCRNSDLADVLQSLSSFEYTFNQKYQYSYVLLNDVPFTETFKETIRNATNSFVEFGIIPQDQWEVPDTIDKDWFQFRLWYNGWRYMYGSSKSYRFMCRYNSRFVYKHPLLQKYRYYWRVEPNVQFNCLTSKRYDPLLFMALAKKRYAYALAAYENSWTVTDLWKHTMEFMKKEGIPMSSFLRDGFYNPFWDDYNNNHFWNNFEIADLEFYRSELYEKYMDALDDSKGWFYHRYGDAPVHTLGVAMLMSKRDIHYFADISYHHEGYGSCPTTSNPNFTVFTDMCWCKRDKSWSDNDCHLKGFDVAKVDERETAQLVCWKNNTICHKDNDFKQAETTVVLYVSLESMKSEMESDPLRRFSDDLKPHISSC